MISFIFFAATDGVEIIFRPLIPPSPVAEHPGRVDPDQHRGEAEPGQGVLEMAVGQARQHPARVREAADLYGVVQ